MTLAKLRKFGMSYFEAFSVEPLTMAWHGMQQLQDWSWQCQVGPSAPRLHPPPPKPTLAGARGVGECDVGCLAGMPCLCLSACHCSSLSGLDSSIYAAGMSPAQSVHRQLFYLGWVQSTHVHSSCPPQLARMILQLWGEEQRPSGMCPVAAGSSWYLHWVHSAPLCIYIYICSTRGLQNQVTCQHTSDE